MKVLDGGAAAACVLPAVTLPEAPLCTRRSRDALASAVSSSRGFAQRTTALTRRTVSWSSRQSQQLRAGLPGGVTSHLRSR